MLDRFKKPSLASTIKIQVVNGNSAEDQQLNQVYYSTTGESATPLKTLTTL